MCYKNKNDSLKGNECVSNIIVYITMKIVLEGFVSEPSNDNRNVL